MTRLPAENPSSVFGESRLELWKDLGFSIEACPIRLTIDKLFSKWTVLLLFELQTGPKRFNSLLKTIPDISRRMLTQSLRDLEHFGLVTRRVIDSRPPGVEYSLTVKGGTFMGPLTTVVDWIERHHVTAR